MVFNSSLFPQQPGQSISEDQFREVELAVAFRKLICHRCEFSSFYRFKTLQVRRKPQLASSQEQEAGPDQTEIWKQIPRFAEIPETIRCRRCNEVLGVYTTCIF